MKGLVFTSDRDLCMLGDRWTFDEGILKASGVQTQTAEIALTVPKVKALAGEDSLAFTFCRITAHNSCRIKWRVPGQTICSLSASIPPNTTNPSARRK
ncbi:hypothetical protein NDI44_27440 [Trichocoleus sp. DQ-A3]|uniref:hypothetical protein n=1 Tax=Cyanophyceae TaxID=3028117 RepID=UPI001682D6DF|nr:hypothetical protein [Coleofasciculus sp. FACHB-125]MBD1903607.1 hypothetical protein [Coleofasciculus sp. FACHB-125]